MKKYFDLQIKDAGGGETMTPQEVLKVKIYYGLVSGEQKMVIHHDDAVNAMTEYASLQSAKDKKRIEELEKEVERLRGLARYGFESWLSENNYRRNEYDEKYIKIDSNGKVIPFQVSMDEMELRSEYFKENNL